MLVGLEEVVAEIEVSSGEIVGWIEKRWILPTETDGRFLFDEADRARAKLIAELHRDLGVGDEAMPLVLRLLDQIYTLRRALSEVHDAIGGLPADVRRDLEARLRKSLEP